MKKILISILTLMIGFTALASNITGVVYDENNEAVIFANVILYNKLDSSLVKLEYTNDDGSFNMVGINDGQYWLSVTYVGYEDFNSKEFTVEDNADIELGNLSLITSATQIEEVTIKAKRPMLEMKADKTVFNVEGSVNSAGSNTLELLRKSPGVMVDNNQNIVMMGKGGVLIYIDGKPSQLAGDQLTTYLTSLASDQIDKIELITNPSAKYDAEGNAGIINIILKKNKNHGANGSISLSGGQGERSNYSSSMRGNYRNEKWNLFGNVGASKWDNVNTLNINRTQFGTNFDQRGLNFSDNDDYNYRVGIDHFINDNHTVGVLFKQSSALGEFNSNSMTSIMDINTNIMESTLDSYAQNSWDVKDWNANLNYQFKNEDGKSLNVDFDYGYYHNDGNENQGNDYTSTETQSIFKSNLFLTETPTTILIKTGKVDYEQPFLSGQLGVGYKVSSVGTDNTFNNFEQIEGQFEIIPELSNSFDYTEMINAAYVNYSKQIESISIQAGLRSELTSSEGMLTAMIPTENENVKRNYLDFFPSLGISYQLNEKNSFNLNYSRRIDRPSYQDLNPFRSRIDELTFEQGNPFLQPEYTNSFTLGHSWNYMLNTQLNFSHTRDMMGQLTEAFSEDATIIVERNIAEQINTSLSVSAPIPIKEWWSSYVSLTGAYRKNAADFGDGNIINLERVTAYVNAQNTFTLPGGYRAEVSGWYVSPMLEESNFLINSMWSMDVGIQKTFLDDALKVKLGMSDIFKTNHWQVNSDLGPLNVYATGGWDSRRLKLNISYSFGNSNVKSRRRETGLESEKSRIKSD